mmetsp:Transcript_66304/g.117454  ORF Transcript_66304/g.117454 Transcript_66304/m.117454 type:complete len:127 (-) Transcript_66304:3-383(-)
MEAASADELNVAEVVQKLADELGLQELERMRLQPALVGSRAAPASPAISSAIFALFAGGRVSRTVRSGGRAGCRYMHRLLLDVAALARNKGNQMVIAAADGIAPLMALVQSGKDGQQERAEPTEVK